MNHLTFVFVHGLSGWGSYDAQYQRFPYWGMRNGDLIRQLRDRGYEAYAASVSPHGSAYDRACELYAQLSGERTDYGAKHAARYGHERYGPDFSGRPLIPSFDESTKLVLFGHSFGGATIRLFADILKYGRSEECTEDASSFFQGGKGERLFALYTLASPHNGTTAYDAYEDPQFLPESIPYNLKEIIAGKLMSSNNSKDQSKFHPEDCAAYDMHIDNALKLNRNCHLDENVYYFSQPCRITYKNKEGFLEPDEKNCELMFRRTSRVMGHYQGFTKSGLKIDESWQENDGLVNTVSAMYPLNQPHRSLKDTKAEKGVWNVLEVMQADHMALQGGLSKKYEVLPYYLKMLEMITELNQEEK